MLGIENLSLFLFSCVLLNITPGQDTMYAIGRSVAQGRSAGIFSVLGIMTGVLIHTLFAALGLSVVLTTSSLAFGIIKYLGAAYLIWQGVGFLRSKGHQASPAAEEKTRRRRSRTKDKNSCPCSPDKPGFRPRGGGFPLRSNKPRGIPLLSRFKFKMGESLCKRK